MFVSICAFQHIARTILQKSRFLTPEYMLYLFPIDTDRCDGSFDNRHMPRGF